VRSSLSALLVLGLVRGTYLDGEVAIRVLEEFGNLVRPVRLFSNKFLNHALPLGRIARLKCLFNDVRSKLVSSH
jgi:hypothetical protein